MKKILFTPVGSTDPIAGQHDGAILHIARHFDLDEIYLYYSREMCQLDEKDNRYVYCLEKLMELTGKHFIIHKIKRQELTEVHLFDFFLEEFRTEIRRITENEECQLIFNISSGTPAMKSALQVLGTVSEHPVQMVQVATPERMYNAYREDVKGEYDVELQWELNMDNESGTEDRTAISKNINLVADIKKEIIKKQIQHYDYEAAVTVAEDLTEFIVPETLNLLKACAARIKLDTKNGKKYAEAAGYKLYPNEQSDQQGIVEYFLLTRLKVQRKEYADFLRNITPLFFSLLERIIAEEFHLELDAYCEKWPSINGTYLKFWDREQVIKNSALTELLIDRNKGDLRVKTVSSSKLVEFIEIHSKRENLKKLVRSIREVEEKVRNPIAHCITYMTQDVIHTVTGQSAEDILNSLRKLMDYTDIRLSDQDLQSYDRCNAVIISWL